MILAFISSRTPDDRLDSDIVLRDTDADFAATGLRVTSTLRLHRLMTVSTQILRRELGELPAGLLLLVESALKRLFVLGSQSIPPASATSD